MSKWIATECEECGLTFRQVRPGVNGRPRGRPRLRCTVHGSSIGYSEMSQRDVHRAALRTATQSELYAELTRRTEGGHRYDLKRKKWEKV